MAVVGGLTFYTSHIAELCDAASQLFHNSRKKSGVKMIWHFDFTENKLNTGIYPGKSVKIVLTSGALVRYYCRPGIVKSGKLFRNTTSVKIVTRT